MLFDHVLVQGSQWNNSIGKSNFSPAFLNSFYFFSSSLITDIIAILRYQQYNQSALFAKTSVFFTLRFIKQQVSRETSSAWKPASFPSRWKTNQSPTPPATTLKACPTISNAKYAPLRPSRIYSSLVFFPHFWCVLLLWIGMRSWFQPQPTASRLAEGFRLNIPDRLVRSISLRSLETFFAGWIHQRVLEPLSLSNLESICFSHRRSIDYGTGRIAHLSGSTFCTLQNSSAIISQLCVHPTVTKPLSWHSVHYCDTKRYFALLPAWTSLFYLSHSCPSHGISPRTEARSFTFEITCMHLPGFSQDVQR